MVTLILEIDAIPANGELALELDFFFDPTKLQYIPGSWKNLELFRDEPGSALDFAEVNEDPNPTRSNAYFNLLASYSRTPVGKELGSLDFRIADQSSGEIPISIELANPGSKPQVDFVRSGAVEVSAVPVPPALLLLSAPLAWMFARVRRS